MENLIIDCKTGERIRHELTPEEIAAREIVVIDTTRRAHLQRQKYDGAIGRLRETQMGRDILTLMGIGE